MKQEVIIAGFGGQGILLAGQLLAYAGLLEGKQVAWIPSYGPEMRGGTVHCTVTISDEEISSPFVEEATVALIFNLPSLDKFESRIRPGGILLINSSLVKQRPKRKDIQTYAIPANEIAEQLGYRRVANTVMLGSYLELTGTVSIDSIIKSLEKVLPKNQCAYTEINRQALELGAKSVRLLKKVVA